MMPSRGNRNLQSAFHLQLRRRTHTARCFSQVSRRQDAVSHLPRIARPSLWRSIVPRFLRRKTEEEKAIARATPSQVDLGTQRTGTTIAVLGLLVGSFAINVIALRRELVNYSRNTEAKLELLRDVIRRVKNGEAVDVKKLLGTGDPTKEREWEEVVEELASYNNQLRRKYSGNATTRKQTETRSLSEWWSGKGTPSKEAPSEPAKGGPSEMPPSSRPAFMM